MLRGLLLLLVPTVVVAGVCNVVFIMDCSGSIKEKNFKTMKEFVMQLVNQMVVSRWTTRVGVITFGWSPDVKVELQESVNGKFWVLGAIYSRVEYCNGSHTNTHLALDAAETMLPGSTCQNANCLAILLTDGHATNSQKAEDAAKRLIGKRVRIISIGIGNRIDKTELERLASRPSDGIHIPNFDQLLAYVSQVVRKICVCDYIRSQPTCEWKYRTLKWACPPGERPKVRAFWGRTDSTTCVDGVASRFLQNTSCLGSDDVTSKAVQKWCNKKQVNGICRIRAANRKLGGDPCPGTFKYFKACVDCVPASKCEVDTSQPTCNGKYRILKWACPPGQRPKVRAFWGRIDRTTCVDDVPPALLQNDNCPGNPDAAAAAIAVWCNAGGPLVASGQCLIRAVNEKLGGDPCVGTFKYLKVCVDCVDGGP